MLVLHINTCSLSIRFNQMLNWFERELSSKEQERQSAAGCCVSVRHWYDSQIKLVPSLHFDLEWLEYMGMSVSTANSSKSKKVIHLWDIFKKWNFELVQCVLTGVNIGLPFPSRRVLNLLQIRFSFRLWAEVLNLYWYSQCRIFLFVSS